MTITTQAGLLTAMEYAQQVDYLRTTSRAGAATFWNGTLDLAGVPAAGTLAGTSTTQGVVPDVNTAGCPPLDAFGTGLTGYITSVEYSSNIATRGMVADLLFKSGAHNFNAADTLTSQPSYSARIPGLDYKGTQIWLETVTAFTGAQTITITYTNQSGVAGQTTGAQVGLVTASQIGRMVCVPLAAGDSGVQKIESVTSTVATVGTFNVLVLRPLVVMRMDAGFKSHIKGPDLTNLPIIFATSALAFYVTGDAGTTGVFEFYVSIAQG